MGLGGNKKPGWSIVNDMFQGVVLVVTRPLKKMEGSAKNDAKNNDRGGRDVKDEDRQAIEFGKILDGCIRQWAVATRDRLLWRVNEEL